MEYIYASATMGWGHGHLWHKILGYNFPKYPVVTKTVTLKPKIGNPYAIIMLGKNIFNHVGHHNKGFHFFMKDYYRKDLILSIAGTDEEISYMVNYLEDYDLKGIQLSFSYPKVILSTSKNIVDVKIWR